MSYVLVTTTEVTFSPLRTTSITPECAHRRTGQISVDQPYPFHRALFISTEPNADPPKGNLYQVHSVGGRFQYFQQSNVQVSLPDSYAGMVKIGPTCLE
jgi:hypothetical protein